MVKNWWLHDHMWNSISFHVNERKTKSCEGVCFIVDVVCVALVRETLVKLLVLCIWLLCVTPFLSASSDTVLVSSDTVLVSSDTVLVSSDTVLLAL